MFKWVIKIHYLVDFDFLVNYFVQYYSDRRRFLINYFIIQTQNHRGSL